MPSAATHQVEPGSIFYVYLLLRYPVVEAPASGQFDLANVLYVGKGKGYRWRAHFEEALADVQSSKATAIRTALGTDPTSARIEQHAVIVAGHLTEAEAFRLEAVMLHLVGGVRAMENLVAGHMAGELMVPGFDARVFFGAEELAVDGWKVQGDGQLQSDLARPEPTGSVVFVVKGTAASLTETQWRSTGKSGRFKNSTLMVETGEPPTVRRGWNPQQPWSPDEAAARARRFWSGSKESIELWQRLIEVRGGFLALVVPDPRDRRSVVRYIWKLDPAGQWEDYEDYGRRFGFPLGEPVADHPWLGRRLVERSTGRGFLRSPASPGVTLWSAAESGETQR